MAIEDDARKLKTFCGEMALTEGMVVRRMRSLDQCRPTNSCEARDKRRGYILVFFQGSTQRARLEYVWGAYERKWRVMRGYRWKQSYKHLDSALDAIAKHMR